MKQSSSEENTKTLHARVDAEVKQKFDAKRKAAGVKQEYVIERLMKAWVEGKIEI